MTFTPEEIRQWHAERRSNPQPMSDDAVDGDTCLHCGRAVTSSNGVITEDAAICDTCNG